MKTAILAALGIATLAAIVFAGHARHCTGHKTGKCSWAWCRFYDGSDSMHDFNF